MWGLDRYLARSLPRLLLAPVQPLQQQLQQPQAQRCRHQAVPRAIVQRQSSLQSLQCKGSACSRSKHYSLG